jgi:glycosyltransferase involved in cell wall biosynthesis
VWQFIARAAASATRSLQGADALHTWARASTASAVDLVRSEAIDVIWATVPDLSNALLALKVHEATGVPFVVDYRDLLDPDDRSAAMQRRRSWEGRVLQACSGITCVSPKQLELLEEQHPQVKGVRVRVVHNFFLDPALTVEQSDVQSRIVYGGRLYGGRRRLAGFLAALAAFNHGRQTPLCADFYSRHADQEVISSQVREHQVDPYVNIADVIDQDSFDAACRSASILLLVVGHGSKHEATIPAKLFDYFAAGRPILVIGPTGNQAGTLTEKANRGIAVPDDDEAEIHVAMARLLECRNRQGEALDLSFDAVSDYSRSVVTQRLVGLLEQVARKSSP